MAIKVNIVAKINPQDKAAPAKYYANAVHGKRIELPDLAKAISKRCSMREGDVLGVLCQLMVNFTEEISEGNIVSLGELGTFYVNVSSEGAETPEKLTQSLIRGLKVIHQPTKELKKQLLLIDVSIPAAS